MSCIPYKTTSQQKKRNRASSFHWLWLCVVVTHNKTNVVLNLWNPVHLTWHPTQPPLSPASLLNCFWQDKQRRQKCLVLTAPMQIQGQASPAELVFIALHIECSLWNLSLKNISWICKKTLIRSPAKWGIRMGEWREDSRGRLFGGLVSLRWVIQGGFSSGIWICG